MRKSLRLLLICLPVLLSFNLFAANRPFPGYYITITGDTIRCHIEFGDWNRNPRTIQVETNGVRNSFGVTDILGFGLDGYSDYITSKVTYHLNPILNTTFPEEYSDSVQTATVFLKVVIKGSYSLYELVLPERPYYFISEKGGAPDELVYRVKQKDMQRDEDEQYKKTLLGIFLKEGKSDQNFNLINNTTYNASGIQLLIEKLNINDAGVHHTKTHPKVLQFDLFGSAIYANFPSAFDGHFTNGNKFKSQILPAGGVNLLFIIPNRFRSLALGISAGYSGYSLTLNKAGTSIFYQTANFNDTSIYKERYTEKNSFIMTDIYAMYFINHFSKTRFYVKAGVRVNYSLHEERYIIDDYESTSRGTRNGLPTTGAGAYTQQLDPINNVFVAFNASVGVMNGRHRVQFDYCTPAEAGAALDNSFKIGMIGLSYYFAILK